MKKREFTQLPVGEYLLKDCSYEYLAVLIVHEKKSDFECSAHFRDLNANIHDNSIYVFTELVKDEDYYYKIDMKAISGRVGLSSVHGEFSLYNWQLISTYTKDTVESDLKRFKMHQKINIKTAG